MIVIQVLYNHLASEQPYRESIKKAHPVNQMSFKYVEVFFEALNLTYLSSFKLVGIGTFS